MIFNINYCGQIKTLVPVYSFSPEAVAFVCDELHPVVITTDPTIITKVVKRLKILFFIKTSPL